MPVGEVVKSYPSGASPGAYVKSQGTSLFSMVKTDACKRVGKHRSCGMTGKTNAPGEAEWAELDALVDEWDRDEHIEQKRAAEPAPTTWTTEQMAADLGKVGIDVAKFKLS